MGSELDCCSPPRPGWSIIHACKSPCHQRAVGYRGSLKPDHPNYLLFETGDDLFLNIIDPPKPLFKMETFTKFLSFAYERWQRGNNILVHCNQGESRAPTLALLLMSKRIRTLPNNTYQDAARVFKQRYSLYNPGQGIQLYLNTNWDQIN